ncbi:hypothetical protein FISHEDRAFT_30407, partial [Fistulina hepatica ATCC 64428]
MPKAPGSSASPYNSTVTAAGGGTHPPALKRNQACHQCRRRKLQLLEIEVDLLVATCRRSHNHAKTHAPPGTVLPPEPECTFDELPEPSPTAADPPKSRYERLENRINELEALLRQRDTESTHVLLNGLNISSVSPPTTNSSSSLSPALGAGPESSQTSFDEVNVDVDSILPEIPIAPSVFDMSVSTDLVWAGWPQGLPNPELLRHLVDMFFVFHPFAHRLFHFPSFMSSLSLQPTHPKFPTAPVLHAICAVGDFYTAAVSSPPLPNFNEVEADEIFLQRQRLKEMRPDSFAEEQVRLARDTAHTFEFTGQHLFEVLQADILLSWYYWSHSRFVFNTAAHSLRLSVPLGLNMCPPFQSISNSARPASIVPPAKTPIEDEMRRNAFWLAYCIERQQAACTGWAQTLDDEDISQLLPVRGDQFNNGTLVKAVDRQWAHSPNLLLIHPVAQTDSFTLSIKGTMLMARAKKFNLRFRMRHFVGDPTMAACQAGQFGSEELIDPRSSPAFIELDRVISTFHSTFPPHLKFPIQDNNLVDGMLYTACLMPHMATIVLHDPHADVESSGCVSALRILTAARAILDLVYAVWSTSYDITLLDPFCSFAWFTAARVLVRFLQAAVEANSLDQVATLKGELDFVHSAIVKVGSRIPVAFRYAKMLENLIMKRCGAASAPRPPLFIPNPTGKDSGAMIKQLF